jgi:hypothetical protein
MSDHATGAHAHDSRRRFLRAGAGLAGAVSIGAVLAACGRSAAQAPAEQSGPATTLKAYLIIARYNREKWKSLSAAERKQAEQAAEVLFPEKATPLSSPDGLGLAHTFHTGVHAQIPGNYRSMASDTREEILDTIFKDVAAQPAVVPGASARDPGVGWITLVDAAQFASFVELMGGQAGPLWRMYDIEILPLNNDRTTEDVYELMTPVHWNRP